VIELRRCQLGGASLSKIWIGLTSCPPLLIGKIKPGGLGTDRRRVSGKNQLHQVQDKSDEDDEKAGVKFEWRMCPLL
jgi:hypothetical protein